MAMLSARKSKRGDESGARLPAFVLGSENLDSRSGANPNKVDRQPIVCIDARERLQGPMLYVQME